MQATLGAESTMDRTERFYRIELLIRSRGSVTFAALMEDLEVSRATLKRDLEYLRTRLDAPIVYDRDSNGYRFQQGARRAARGGRKAAVAAADTAHELPGVWFSEREIRALLTMHQLIEGLDGGGTLARHLQPLLDKLHGMLGSSETEARELMRRVKISLPAQRPVPARWFERVASALLERRRLQLTYYTRSKDSQSQREVSPQRLLHHRSTWYLDAWCHASDGLRRFALDAVRGATLLDQRAKDVALRSVEAQLDRGYGIYGGGELHQAVLHFSAEAARWVANEQWHPRQTRELLPDGSLRLTLPYSEDTELLMDLMRHGPHVEVEAPAELRERLQERLRAALERYSPEDGGSSAQ
jgi:predicted DNA-binding transcriptional regulator YafY